MPNEEDYIIIKEKKKSSNWMYLVLFGIILFLMVYFPFFGSNLRYKFGVYFSLIFNTIGTLLIFLGIIAILYGVLSFIYRSPLRGFVYLMLGVILLTFAGYFLNPTSIGTGPSGAGKDIPEGFH